MPRCKRLLGRRSAPEKIRKHSSLDGAVAHLILTGRLGELDSEHPDQLLSGLGSLIRLAQVRHSSPMTTHPSIFPMSVVKVNLNRV
jgi:hypothetical protein